ncbi:MAG: hypothetical protein K2W95_01460 [Candidatus Obscuribacterales bacterium]|nr:hypothetical protein [Candidatus Obscuribacterales bacterium]
MGDNRRPEDTGRQQSAEASQEKQAAENLLNDFFPQIPESKAKEAEEKTTVASSTDKASEKKFEDMSPKEHFKAIAAALENAAKLFNTLPTELKDELASANYESGTINPSDLADPKKIRGFLSTLEQRIS